LLLFVPIVFYFLGTKKIEKLQEWIHLVFYVFGIYLVVMPFADRLWYVLTGVPYETYYDPIILGWAWWCWFGWIWGGILVVTLWYLKNKE
jgi:hypothetical protein